METSAAWLLPAGRLTTIITLQRAGRRCPPGHTARAGAAGSVGCQPTDGSQIPGIRKWPEAYLPKIYDRGRVDRLEYVSQTEAEDMTRRLAREEGIFAGISSGGAVHVALRISRAVENAVIVAIICDRGDRYLSTGVFPA